MQLVQEMSVILSLKYWLKNCAFFKGSGFGETILHKHVGQEAILVDANAGQNDQFDSRKFQQRHRKIGVDLGIPEAKDGLCLLTEVGKTIKFDKHDLVNNLAEVRSIDPNPGKDTKYST